MFRQALLLVACLSSLRADGLSDLRARLQGLPHPEGLKAGVDLEIWRRQGDEKQGKVTQGRASVWLEEQAQGLRLTWSKDQLERAAKEGRARQADPEAPAPVRDAMAALKVLDLAEYLRPAERLLQDLDGAALVEDRMDALDGKPARLLVLRLQPKLSARDRKYVKDLEATARIWLDSEGLPLAEEQAVKIRGKALLVISFSQEEQHRYRFRRIQGGLVTLRHERATSGSGGGESGQSRNTVALAFS